MVAPTKVLIVEDEPAIAQDIEFVLEEAGYEVVGRAHTSEKAITILDNKKVDVALLDIKIQGDRDGIELGHIINKDYQIPFVFLTSHSDLVTLNRVKETSPYGYIVKPYKDRDLAPALEIALVRYASNDNTNCPALKKVNASTANSVTNQEYKILELIWKGFSNQQIADTLFVSINTVKTHVSSLFLKLEVHSKNEVIAKLRVL